MTKTHGSTHRCENSKANTIAAVLLGLSSQRPIDPCGASLAPVWPAILLKLTLISRLIREEEGGVDNQKRCISVAENGDSNKLVFLAITRATYVRLY